MSMDDQWIDANESLPKIGEYVLCAVPVDWQTEYMMEFLKIEEIITTRQCDAYGVEVEFTTVNWRDKGHSYFTPHYWRKITPPTGKE